MDDGKQEDQHFKEERFWKKFKRKAKRAGRKVIRTVLVLYYCLIDKDTPTWAQGVITGALGYFILPVDAIPDIIPTTGYSDDLVALAAAASAVALHIKPKHKERADEKL